MICLLHLDFEVLRPIRSLPPFHGARWAAVWRLLCRAAAVDIEQILLGIYPLQSGQEPLYPEDTLTVRVLTPFAALPQWQLLFSALQDGLAEAEGEFVPGKTLRFAAVRVGVEGRALHAGMDVAHLEPALVCAQATALNCAPLWRMVFDAPLRLPRPEGTRDRGHHFCDAAWFAEHPTALRYLAEKIRFVPPSPASGEWPRLLASDLTWEDMRYSRERGIALGGVIGALTFAGPPDPTLSRHLALGQYTGIGKNSRFGLGYYRLEIQNSGCKF